MPLRSDRTETGNVDSDGRPGVAAQEVPGVQSSGAAGDLAIDDAAAPMRLEPTAREVLAGELEAFVLRLGDVPAAARYAALLAAVQQADIPADLVGELERLLELGLETGRFRSKYGGYPADALLRLYHRTPRGAAVAASARGVSDALAALEGQTLQSIRVAAGPPGSYTLTVETDRAHLMIRLSRGGARVDTVEV